MSDSIENMSFLESTENSDSDIHDANIAATQDHDMSSTDGESWKLVDNSSDDDDSESADNEIVKWGSQLDMEAYEMENRSGEFNSEKDSPASVTQNQEVLSLISFDDAEMVSIVTAESTVTELPSTSTAASYPLVIRNNPWRKFAKHNVHKQNVKKCSHSSFNTKATLNCRISSIQHASPDSNLHRCCNAPKFGNTKIIPSTTVELATRKEFMDKVKKALQSDTTVVAENGTANKPPTGAQANAQIQAIMSNQMNDAEKTADRFSGTSRQQQSTLFNSNLYWTENPPKTSNMNILTSNKPKLVTHEEFAANVKEVRSDDAEKMTKLEASKEERLNLDLTMQVKRDLKNFIEKAVQNDASLLQQQSDSKDRDTHNAGTSNDSVHKNTMTSNPDVIVKCSCVKCSRGQVYNGEQSRCQRQQCGKWHESFLPEIQRRKNSHMFRTQMYFPATEPFLNLGVPNPQDANAMKLARIMRATNECHNKFHLPRRSPIKKPSFERVQNPQEVETTNFVNILKEMNQNSKPVKSEGNNAELEENAHTNDHSPPSNKNEVQNNESEASEEFNPIAVEPAHMSENENFEDEGFVDDTEENEGNSKMFSWRWNITNCLVLMMVILISLSFGCFIQNYIYKKQEFATLQSSITELQSELIFLRHKNFVTTRQLSSIVELFNLPSDSNMGSIGPEPKTFRAKIMLLFSTIYVHLGYLFTALINQISKYSSWEQFLFYHMCFGGFFVMCYLATRLFSLVRILGGCFFRFIK